MAFGRSHPIIRLSWPVSIARLAPHGAGNALHPAAAQKTACRDANMASVPLSVQNVAAHRNFGSKQRIHGGFK
jgi:hypothetical protein